MMLGSVAYVESGVMLYSLLAVIWAVVGLQRGGWRPMAVAGALGGFACGTKYTAVAMTAVPLALFWPVIAWRTRGRQIVKPLLAFGLTCAIIFLPWLIRNVVWTGNPVFPLMTRVFGRATFTADQIERYELAHQPPPAERALSARLSAAFHRVLADPQFGYAFPWLTGVAVIVLIVRRASFFLVAMLLAMAVVWLLATHDMPRFLTPAIPLAAVILGIAIPQSGNGPRIGRAILATQAAFGFWWTCQTLGSFVDLGRQGFFRLTDPSPLTLPDLEPALQSNGHIALIGDSQAFFQPFPSNRLLYRGVFDVNIPPGTNIVDGWLGKSVEQLRKEGYWVVINADELVRLSKTYAHLPAPPAPFDQAGQPPIVLPPTSAPQAGEPTP